MKNPDKFKKNFLLAISAFALFIAAILSKEYYDNTHVESSLPDVPMPKNAKILVIAPHNDDEALGASIFIKKALAQGNTVKVLVVTNGDGFTEALDLYNKKLFEKPADYIQFGYERQKETLAAMALLGLDAKDIIFFGYPDGGLYHLWQDHYNTPYTSKYTKVNQSPYSNSYHPDAAYQGANLAADMEKLLLEYRPDVLVYSHPNDKHPDHWAVHAFVKHALENLSTKNQYRPSEELLFLIHQGDWPVPMKYDPGKTLEPPAALMNTGTRWQKMPLSQEETDLKNKVLRTYKSQFPALEKLILAFVRENELFGTIQDPVLIAGQLSDGEITAKAENQILQDPVDADIRDALSNASDIKALYAEISKEKNLHIFVEMEENTSPLIRYELNLNLLRENDELRLSISEKDSKVTALEAQNKVSEETLSEISITHDHSFLHFVIPSAALGDSHSLLLSASTYASKELMDRTALQVVRNPLRGIEITQDN